MELARQSDPKNKEQACRLAGMALMACESMQLDRAGRYAHVVNIWDLLNALSTGSATSVFLAKHGARANAHAPWTDSLFATCTRAFTGQVRLHIGDTLPCSNRAYRASTTPEMYLAPRAVSWQAMDDPMIPAPITTTCGPVALAILRSLPLQSSRMSSKTRECAVVCALPA